MKLLFIIPAILLLDLIRSAIIIRRLHVSFYKAYKSQPELYIQGKGPDFHMVLLGDSGIDGHANNKLKFGPAQTLIEKLSKKYKVTVHIFAKESSRTYDVIERQLPKVKALQKVDMICVYMGANNAFRGQSTRRVRADYVQLLDYAQNQSIPVVATEIANYYLLPMFSLIQKLIAYACIKICNHDLNNLAKQYDNFVLAGMSWLTKKYITPDYMADKLHPNDVMIRMWADAAYNATMADPTIKKILS